MPDLLIVSLLWSFSFVIIKGTLTTLDSNFVSAVRLLLAMVVFLPSFRWRGLNTRIASRLMMIGAVQFGVMYACYIASFAYLPAYMIVLLTTTTPLFVVFFDMALSRRNVPNFWLAAVLAVAAGALLRFQGGGLAFNWRGVALVQASNAAFALGQVVYRQIARRLPDEHPQSSFALLYAGGAGICLAASLFTVEWGTLTVSPMQWGMLGYLGIVASGLCFFLWNRGAVRVGAGTLALMNNLKIPLGVIVSIVMLHEAFHAGILMLSLALFLLALLVSRKAEA